MTCGGRAGVDAAGLRQRDVQVLARGAQRRFGAGDHFARVRQFFRRDRATGSDRLARAQSSRARARSSRAPRSVPAGVRLRDRRRAPGAPWRRGRRARLHRDARVRRIEFDQRLPGGHPFGFAGWMVRMVPAPRTSPGRSWPCVGVLGGHVPARVDDHTTNQAAPAEQHDHASSSRPRRRFWFGAVAVRRCRLGRIHRAGSCVKVAAQRDQQRDARGACGRPAAWRAVAGGEHLRFGVEDGDLVASRRDTLLTRS